VPEFLSQQLSIGKKEKQPFC